MKTFFITGASSGIGQCVAVQFAKKGFNICLFARRTDRLEKTKQQCISANPNIKVMIQTGDVTVREDLDRAVEHCLKEFGTIDIVFANAGFGVMGFAESLKLEDYQRQFKTNIDGVLNTYYATIEHLKKTKGNFSIVGSVNSYLTSAKASAYTMSKHAIKALAGSLWLEHQKDNVAVTLICPGLVKSEIHFVDNQGKLQPGRRSEPPSFLVMETEKAAKVITRAILKRKRQEIVTFHGKVFVFLVKHFEGFTFFLQQFFKKFIHSRLGSHQEKKEITT